MSTSGLDTEYVDSFRIFLADRLAPGSISQYLRNLRSLLSAYLGPEYREHIKSAFGSVDSKNESETRRISASDFLRIKTDPRISQHLPLDKARDLFLLSTLLGGMPIDRIAATLDSMIRSGYLPLTSGESVALPEPAYDIIARFRHRFSISLPDYLSHLSDADYVRRLDAIGAMLQLRNPLLPRSSADAWMAMARAAAIPSPVIAACINCDVALKKYVCSATAIAATELQNAYTVVSDRIESNVRHWYAMRCYADSPDGIKERMLSHISGGSISDCDIYLPPVDGPSDRVLQPILFFRTTSANAMALKRHLGGDVYIYSYRTGDKKPAIISNQEMMTFMLLANVGGDTIRVYFPGTDAELPAFEVNEMVTITNGDFSGMVGVVEKTSRDTMRVVVRITGISAIITAEVPLRFLRGVGDRPL